MLSRLLQLRPVVAAEVESSVAAVLLMVLRPLLLLLLLLNPSLQACQTRCVCCGLLQGPQVGSCRSGGLHVSHQHLQHLVLWLLLLSGSLHHQQLLLPLCFAETALCACSAVQGGALCARQLQQQLRHPPHYMLRLTLCNHMKLAG
jgi:hypothetical protein